jgi:two-component system response regulator
MDYIFSTGRFSTRGGPGALKMVLLDLKLPRVDGIEVLRRIKSDPRTKSIPVVVLTSSKEEPDIEESYRLGANSYVVKPVDFDAFAHTVQRIGIYWLQLNQRASADFQDGASVGHDG